MSTKRLLMQVHKWTGLVLGLLLVFMAATGSALSHGDLVMQTLSPELYARRDASERELSPGTVVERLRTQDPAFHVAMLRYPHDRSGAILAIGGSHAAAHGMMSGRYDGVALVGVDPASGAINGREPLLANPVILMAMLHMNLMLGPVGSYIVAASGFVLAGLCLTGLVIWWPGRRRLGFGFNIRWRAPGKVLVYDLHRVSGALFALAIGMVALTGAVLALPGPTADAINAPPIEQPIRLGGAGEAIDADTAFVRASGRLPGQHLYTYMPPMPGADRHSFTFVDARAARSTLWVEAGDASRGGVRDSTAGTAGRRSLDLMYPLHSGHFWGRWGLTAYVLLGLLPVVWGVTGLIVYISRRRPRRRQPNPYYRRPA